jgi:hypothetical protein
MCGSRGYDSDMNFQVLLFARGAEEGRREFPHGGGRYRKRGVKEEDVQGPEHRGKFDLP